MGTTFEQLHTACDEKLLRLQSEQSTKISKNLKSTLSYSGLLSARLRSYIFSFYLTEHLRVSLCLPFTLLTLILDCECLFPVKLWDPVGVEKLVLSKMIWKTVNMSIMMLTQNVFHQDKHRLTICLNSN